MSSAIPEDDDDSQSETEHQSGELYGVRDGIIFLIDASPEMFERNDEGKCFFQSCIEEYIYILKQKMAWNRKDWMGLILFGTEKWDKDPEVKHILTLQKLDLVNIDKLKEAEEIRDKTWEDYKKMSSSTSYPLHDVLWHAAQCFASIKETISARRVILYTCHDVPPLTDDKEKHRIRTEAATYNDLEILFYVVGLRDEWSLERFYKDLEMLSRNITNEDYQRVSYKELVQQVKRPSRHMAKLPWRIGQDAIINVDISSLCVKSEYLKKIPMSSVDKTPLTSHNYYRVKYDNEKNNEEIEEDEEDEEEGGKDEKKIDIPVRDIDLRKTKEFGGEKIYFTLQEAKSFSNIYPPGIDVIDVKPLSCDPMYHCQAPYFVSCNKKCSIGEKTLFAGLLNKCSERNLMLVCRATLRKNVGTFLYNMMPVSAQGGFYLHRIPYEENANIFIDNMYEFAYNDSNNKPPINDEGIQLFEKVIKKSQMVFDPETFANPKLQVTMLHVEALALNLNTPDTPDDETLPMVNVLQKRIGSLIKEVKDFFSEDLEHNLPAKKQKKSEKETSKHAISISSTDVLELVEQNQLHLCKVSDLKTFLKDVGLSTEGLKIDLMHRLYTYYDKKADRR